MATELPTSMGIKQSSSLTLAICMYIYVYALKSDDYIKCVDIIYLFTNAN